MPRRPRNRVPGNAAALTDQPRGTASYYRDLTAAYGRAGTLVLDPDLPPWDQQRGETAKQYAYFLQYRDTPAHARSLVQLALIVDKDRNYLSVLNRSKLWGERVLAWDTEQRRKYELLLEKRREELITQHLRVSDAGFAVVLRKLAEMDPTSLSARDLGPFVAAMGDLARKALGMDTQQGPRITVQAQAVSAAQAKAVSAAEGQVEAREQMETILAQMETMVEGMSEEQRQEAMAAWAATAALPAGTVVEGEVVE